MNELQIDTPQEGWFKTRLVRGGPWVPVKIWNAPDGWRATKDGKDADPFETWNYCAGRRVTKEEFDFLTADSAHAKAHRPEDAKATPATPVNFGSNSANMTALDQAEVLIAEARALEKVATLDQAQAAVMLVKRITKAAEKLDEARKDAKAPHAEAMAAAEAPYKAAGQELNWRKALMLSMANAFRVSAKLDKLETDYGPKLYTKRTAKVAAINEDELPLEYWTPDLSKINAAVKAGTAVPGVVVEITETPIVS